MVVYKVDRLTRALADFARLVEIFDTQGVSFVSVTQQFNTTSSMGRLTLNVLLSFAQFEREVTGERIRDKIAASKTKGMWMGGNVPLGYDASEGRLVVNPVEAETVRRIFALCRELGSVRRAKEEADRLGLQTKRCVTANGTERGGNPFARGHLYRLLSNPIYAGQITHKGQLYPGQQRALIDNETWTAVRDQLAANAGDHRYKAKSVEPSLLAGLLADARGERLTPSHAVKTGRRYRVIPIADTGSQPCAILCRLPIGSTTEQPMVRRLSAGGRWIRTLGPGATKREIARSFRSDRGHYRRRAAPDPQHQQRGRQASEAARHKRRGDNLR